jgi:hypothetical protein
MPRRLDQFGPVNRNFPGHQTLSAWWLAPHGTRFFGGQFADLTRQQASEGALNNGVRWSGGPSAALGALSFDGSDDYVAMPAAEFGNALTCLVTFRPKADVTSGTHSLFTARSDAFGFVLELSFGFSAGTFYGGWYHNGGGGDLRATWTPSGVTAGAWHQMAMCFSSGGSTQLFFNGDNVATNASDPSASFWDVAGLGTVWVGGGPNNSWASANYANIDVAEVKLWSGRLANDQVARHHQDFRAGYPNALRYGSWVSVPPVQFSAASPAPAALYISTSKTRPKKPKFGARLNRSHPLANRIAGVWLFNEGAGAVSRNLVAGGEDISLAGGATFTRGALGRPALRTTGAGDYAQVNTPPSFSMTSSTIAVIATCLGVNSYSAGGAPNTFEYVVTVPITVSGLAADYAYYYSQGGYTAGSLFRSLSASGADISATEPEAEARPTLMASTYDGTTLWSRLGVESASIVYGGTPSYNGPLRLGVGSFGGWDGAFNGVYEAFYVYDRPLGPDELSWLNNEPFSLFYPDRNVTFLLPPSSPFSWRNDWGGGFGRVSFSGGFEG